MNKNKNFAGFTLIELLVVIVIIGILATISVSTFNGYLEKARLAKAQFFYKQINNLFLASQAAGGKDDLFGLKYTFDGNTMKSDPNPTVIDQSNYQSSSPWMPYPGSFSQSTDTPLGIGNSATIEKQSLFITIKNKPIDKFTIGFWIKLITQPTSNLTFSSHFAYGGIKGMLVDKNGIKLLTCNYCPDMIIYNEPLKLNKWYYLLGSYDGNTMRLWVDGELIGIRENVSNIGTFSSRFDVWSGYANNIGRLDELMVIPYGFDGKKLK